MHNPISISIKFYIFFVALIMYLESIKKMLHVLIILF